MAFCGCVSGAVVLTGRAGMQPCKAVCDNNRHSDLKSHIHMLSLNSMSLNRDCTVQISLRFGSMIGYKDNGQKRIQSPHCTLADIHMLVLLLMTEKLLLWQVILKKNRQIAGLFIIFVLVSPI